MISPSIPNNLLGKEVVDEEFYEMVGDCIESDN
jgi:hypothetical protein